MTVVNNTTQATVVMKRDLEVVLSNVSDVPGWRSELPWKLHSLAIALSAFPDELTALSAWNGCWLRALNGLVTAYIMAAGMNRSYWLDVEVPGNRPDAVWEIFHRITHDQSRAPMNLLSFRGVLEILELSGNKVEFKGMG